MKNKTKKVDRSVEFLVLLFLIGSLFLLVDML
jgi:hypothetical protein